MKLLELYNQILLETEVYTPENVTSFPAKDIEGVKELIR